MIRTIGNWTQAPDLIEPIIGYRAWPFVSDDRGVRLVSVAPAPDDDALGGWTGSWRRWVTAYCAMVGADHLAPDEACTCGFYATKARDDSPSLEMVVSVGAEIHSTGTSAELHGMVFGCLHLAGRVIEHDFGYRAERARIVELIPTSDDRGSTELLAARLDLPLGPSIDTTELVERVRQEASEMAAQPRRPLSPVERVRLKTHRRHFRMIAGEPDGR